MTKEEITNIVMEVLKSQLNVTTTINCGSDGYVEVTTDLFIGDERIYTESNYDWVKL